MLALLLTAIPAFAQDASEEPFSVSGEEIAGADDFALAEEEQAVLPDSETGGDELPSVDETADADAGQMPAEEEEIPSALTDAAADNSTDTADNSMDTAADNSTGAAPEITIKAITSKTYTGSAITPDPVIRAALSTGKVKRLVQGTDYTLSYENNINAGTATVKVDFCGNYSGSQTTTFTIKPRTFHVESTEADHDFVKDITAKTYTGSAIRPNPIVKAYLDGKYRQLTRGTDYTVAYKNNTDAGTATAIVKFRGNYAGSANVTKTFTIKQVAIASVTLPHTEMQYTGTARTMTKSAVVQAVVGGETVTLTRGTDYSISYQNNIEVGTATMVVKGKGNFKGTIKKTFEITKVPLSTAYFTQYSFVAGKYLKQNSFGYNGDLKKPSVVVKAKVGGKEVVLTKGTDYTITYSNNRNIGTAKATIVGKGNYSGKLIKTFTIHMIDYVQWAKYVADDNETYRNYGHTLPSKDSDGAFSCSSLVGAALYLNGYISSLPPDGHGWLGGLVKKATCLEGQMMLHGFQYYSAAELGSSGIAQNSLNVLKPGDIMWRYHGSSGMHVGIYMGDGLFIESRGGTDDPNAIGVFPDFNYFEGIFRLDGKYLK